MNIEEIDKWLDNEYGVSYTRLEELHDFVVEQDLKHREEKDKEIDRLNNLNKQLVEECQRLDDEETRLNNIINELEKWCNECIDYHIIARENGDTTISDTFFEIVLDKLKELKENK